MPWHAIMKMVGYSATIFLFIIERAHSLFMSIEIILYSISCVLFFPYTQETSSKIILNL